MQEQPAPTGQDTLFDSEEMVLNMGPQHPSTHGVLRVILRLDGETVVGLDCDIGYLHRGVEKIAEHDTYAMITPYWDRLDYVAAVSNDLCYVEGVEKLLQVEVPKRAEYLRVILTELQRIASHLLWLGTHALDIGAVTVLLYAFREREEILKIFEDFIGARLTAHAFRIGGLWWDVFPEFDKRVRDFLKILPGRIEEYETLLNANRIWLQRTVGIGILPAEEAINLSLTGPGLRGSGVKYDVRKAQPYSAYSDFNFEIPIGENGDTYDRYLCRMEEIKQSALIIEQALDGVPEGPVMAKVPKVFPLYDTMGVGGGDHRVLCVLPRGRRRGRRSQRPGCGRDQAISNANSPAFLYQSPVAQADGDRAPCRRCRRAYRNARHCAGGS